IRGWQRRALLGALRVRAQGPLHVSDEPALGGAKGDGGVPVGSSRYENLARRRLDVAVGDDRHCGGSVDGERHLLEDTAARRPNSLANAFSTILSRSCPCPKKSSGFRSGW